MGEEGARGLRGIGIVGIGTALPPKVRDNSFWNGVLVARDETQRRGDVLAVERTSSGARTAMPREIADAIAATGDDLFRGARLRHVIDDDDDVSELEAAAGRAALRDAGVDPESIDLLLVHSLMPDRLIPSNAPAVQDRLGLTRAAAWSLDVGCASFQAQLVTAAALIRAGTFRRALIVQSHAGTRSVDPTSVASVNFGDGAAAAVIERVPDDFGVLGHYARTDGSLRDGIVLAPVVEGAPRRAWWEGQGRMQLASFDADAGKSAGLRAGEFCREACSGALRDAGLTLDDVDLYTGNQSLGWFLDACRRSLGLPRDRTVDTFARIANVGDAAIVFNLQEARAQGRLEHGRIALLYSPAAGFTRTAVVVRWYDVRRCRV
ncbi:3-oxoacyl-ACP synthase III family protein [Sandaracinus amylolyticus]|uniref:3-oxoacyl-ACP synthase III family protein n=1 Tax=Sandaracinus amylolyticus TaxID=927083 RepID=UPI001F331388|nr:3-oxoacyl-[acyl-carrier-protein] synthase III C-terminal domain-containing protein [Sandaracinus amylolyticus]UJR81342.1 3-oxoacyl-[acyl-carrier-protein] synthase, KASIII [Sandaracinus amylolyticus]